jgi:hypothetical protein
MASRILVGIGLLAVVPALIAAERLNVKTGLWEITSVTEVSGMPPLPKELLDQMTPQQREEMRAAMKAEQAKGPESDTDRECITEKELETPFESADKENCKQTIVATTRTTQEVRLVCAGEYKGEGFLRVSTPTPTTMTGLLELTAGAGPDAMKIKAQMKGRWLSSDCGEEAQDQERVEEETDDEETSPDE